MQHRIIAAAALVLAGTGAAAFAGPDRFSKVERELQFVAQKHERGHARLDQAARARTRSARMNYLDGALYHLRQTRAAVLRNQAKGPPEAFVPARIVVEQDLVTALNEAAAVHFERQSYRNARKHVQEALTIAPHDSSSLHLLAAIADAESDDWVDADSGVTSVRRQAARRAGIGAPFRERGFLLRR